MYSQSNLDSEDFVYPPDDTYPLFITAKRYRMARHKSRSFVTDPSNALVLICLHSTSFHKEVWEPTLDHLFHIAEDRSPIRILEAWVVECPNHGSSAILNEAYFRYQAHSGQFGCRKYSHAVHRFLISNRFNNFMHRKDLVLVGHSLGAVASCFLRALKPHIDFRSHIIIEPVMTPVPSVSSSMDALRRRSVALAYERRDVWPSREQARIDLKSANWHPRVLELYLEHGLREHPATHDTRVPYTGVTIACSREEEAGMYKDIDGPLDSVPLLKTLCKAYPVHIIFGEFPDFVPVDVRRALCDPSSEFKFASATTMKNIGHIIPQVAPADLAHEMHKILSASEARKSKL